MLKITGITNLESARNAASLGPDFLGIRISATQSPAVSPIDVPEILPWLPNTQVVLELMDYGYDQLQSLHELLKVSHYEMPNTPKAPLDADITLFIKDPQKAGATENYRYGIMPLHAFKSAESEIIARSFVEVDFDTPPQTIQQIAEGAKGFQFHYDPEAEYEVYEGLLKAIGR